MRRLFLAISGFFAAMAAATVVVLYTAANYLIANAPGLRALGALNA